MVIMLKIFLLLMKFGSFLNLLGSIFIAFSFGRNLGNAYQEDKNGRKVYLASFLYPRLFRLGLALVIIGFFLTLTLNIMS